MVRSKYDFNDDEGQISKFNAGLLQMQRIHVLQDRINNAWLNPLAQNNEFGVWNYNVIYNSCNSLLQEVSSKLSDKEKEEGFNTKNIIDNFMIKNPVHTEKNRIIKINLDTWNILKRILYKYETIVREYLDKHGMSSPEIEEEALF